MDLQGSFHVYDTTLRDGAQQEGLNLSVADKLSIARQLDGLGVGYIEGGWPGANPKDTEFFRRARQELDLRHARLAAFGATRRPGVRAADDPLASPPCATAAPAWSPWSRSRTTGTSSSPCARRWRRTSPWSATASPTCARRASRSSSTPSTSSTATAPTATTRWRCCARRTTPAREVVALCDTNGGMLPGWVGDVVHDVIETTGVRVGIHCHNDTGCAVANTLAAVDAGASHVQGTINGYGERTGNADLVTVVANLELKLDRQVLPTGLLREATRIAHAVAEVTNFPPGVAPAVRRHLGVHPQGRAARQRDQGRPEPLPAHGPGRRRQRHAAAGLGHGRAGLDPPEEPRARLRPDRQRRRQGAGRPGHRPGQGAGVARLHLRGRRRLLRAAAGRGGRGPRGRRTSTSSRGG